MNVPPDDIHPLDRDYSSPVAKTLQRGRTLDEKVRRLGIVIFAMGFALVLLAAIILSVWNGVERIESFGSFLHRFAMLTILCGGIAVMVSYRLSLLQQRGKRKRQNRNRSPFSGFFCLIGINVIFFLFFLFAAFFIPLIPREMVYFVFNSIFSIMCSLAVTMIIWHRGMMRAFGIGVLVALLFNTFGALLNFSGGSPFGILLGGFLAHLLIVQVSGLFCAGYVSFLALKPYLEHPVHCGEESQVASE